MGGEVRIRGKVRAIWSCWWFGHFCGLDNAHVVVMFRHDYGGPCFCLDPSGTVPEWPCLTWML